MNTAARKITEQLRLEKLHIHWIALALLVSLAFLASTASAQISNAVNGTVTRSTSSSITVRTADNQYIVFTFARGVRKPKTIAVGTQVRVLSNLTEEQGVRQATDITVVAAGSGVGEATAANGQTVPPEVGRIERDVERSARHYQIGVSAGVGLDPEVIQVGVTGQFGPIFTPDLYFRPGVGFGWGEVTTLLAANPEFVYRLPLSARSGRWTTYVGGGPGFNFTHRSFKQTTGSGSRVSFHDFQSDTTLNILAGIQHRSGMFTEIKTSVYAQTAPVLGLTIGYHF